MALLQIKTALVDPLTVQSLTGLSELGTKQRVEDGTFAAFHLETRSSRFQLLRIVPASVLNHLDGLRPIALNFAGWFDVTFPGAFLPASDIAQKLVVSPDHAIRLVKTRELEVKPGSKIRSGRGGSPLVTRTSLRRFLQSREVGALS